jgi:hypothetical protein
VAGGAVEVAKSAWATESRSHGCCVVMNGREEIIVANLYHIA